jgi:hypothetical protein
MNAYRTAPEVAPERAWFKSSYSENNGTACVEVAHLIPAEAWFKSSHSSNNGTSCVEIADLTAHGGVAVRDSKDPSGPALIVSPAAWSSFITAIRTRALS